MPTEQEAREKWCPMMGAEIPVPNCIGSRCMAWRWDNTSYDAIRHRAMRDNQLSGMEYDTAHAGHCGLAGKP